MTAIPPDARALTIRQPWASLVALGVKTIETRSWSTAYRGPLVIHAGKATPSLDNMRPVVDNFDTWRTWCAAGLAPGSAVQPGPLGAVVAVVDLVDVVPCVRQDEVWRDFVNDRHISWLPSTNKNGGHLNLWTLGDTWHAERQLDDQWPYGDFTPGRYAWLLDNVRPVDPPVPAKGRQGLWRWNP